MGGRERKREEIKLPLHENLTLLPCLSPTLATPPFSLLARYLGMAAVSPAGLVDERIRPISISVSGTELCRFPPSMAYTISQAVLYISTNSTSTYDANRTTNQLSQVAELSPWTRECNKVPVINLVPGKSWQTCRACRGIQKSNSAYT